MLWGVRFYAIIFSINPYVIEKTSWDHSVSVHRYIYILWWMSCLCLKKLFVFLTLIPFWGKISFINLFDTNRSQNMYEKALLGFMVWKTLFLIKLKAWYFSKKKLNYNIQLPHDLENKCFQDTKKLCCLKMITWLIPFFIQFSHCDDQRRLSLIVSSSCVCHGCFPFFCYFLTSFSSHTHTTTPRKALFHVHTSNSDDYYFKCVRWKTCSISKGDKAAKEEKIVSANLDFGATRQERGNFTIKVLRIEFPS